MLLEKSLYKMGMFLSKYSMLRALGYNEDGYVLPETKKILSKFRMFALVLHDPKNHPEFDRKFREIFPRLDYLTGEKMLFFGLTNPPSDWVKANQGRDYFGIWEKEKLLDPANAYATNDDSLTAYSIANTLEIDYDDLPVLIISNDFQNRSFVVIKTCVQHIEKQLTEVGLFATDSPYEVVYLQTEKFKKVLKSIDLCGGEFTIKNLAQSLAKHLSDILAFAINNSNSLNSSEIAKHRKRVIQEISEGSKTGKDTSLILKNKTILHSFLSLLSDKFQEKNQLLFKEELNFELEPESDYNSSRNNKHLTIEKERLEKESSIILKGTEKIISNFEQEYGEKDIADYSPIIIGIGKIFEKEINFSVVHWIRKKLNIDLPEFFNKYEPGQQCIYIPSSVENQRSIDFNRGNAYKWMPPGMGESEHVVSDWFRKGNYIEFFDSATEQELISGWNKLRRIRNNAAHMDITDFNSYVSAVDEMNKLSNQNIFSRLFDLKDLYSGRREL
jgi:hypothetical protein